MNTFSVFAPITKVDAVKRLVYGVLASETLDKSGEVFDYESSKPLVEEWSGEIKKNSGGKSEGNLRGMHQPIIIGKFVQVACNDDRKSIDVCAHVSDDEWWGKVERGEVTGFSVGGAYEKRWKDGDVWKYTARPAEGSLVDNPCNPDATFSMIKADGTSVLRKFTLLPEPAQKWLAKDGAPFDTKDEARKHNAELAKAAAAASDPIAKLEAAIASSEAAVTKLEAERADPTAPAKVEKKEFSDEQRSKLADEGKALPDGSYPIENTSDLKNAIQSFGRAKNKAKVKAHIKARAKALGAEGELPDSWKDGADKSLRFQDLRKGLYEVGRFASIIMDLEWLQQSCEYEADYEKDESTIPESLKEDIANLCATLRAMVEEETNELLDGEEALEYGELLEMAFRPAGVDALAKALGAGDGKSGVRSRALLAKVGMRHGAGDQEHVNAAHDHFKKAMGEHGADCASYMPGAEKSAADNKMAHLAHGHNMTKAAGAECPGGMSKCAPYGAAKADGGEKSLADHVQAAHDHLAKMGIGACAGAEKMAKAGARHSKADMESLTHAHDAAKSAGAACPGGTSDCTKEEEPAEKVVGAELQKLLATEQAKTSRLEESLGKATDAITSLTARVDKFAKLPLPRPHERAPTRTVTKGEPDTDDIFARLEKLTPEERDEALKEYARSLPAHLTR